MIYPLPAAAEVSGFILHLHHQAAWVWSSHDHPRDSGGIVPPSQQNREGLFVLESDFWG
ncbi:hypothetical protein GFS31_31760 [Leptolyngbya sp. BL0902]|nr:hypothetical protein GFS31_31760 [Leptolyngbya sp. BL0902]